MKDSVRDNYGLMQTTLALTISPRDDQTSLAMVTLGAAKTIRPLTLDRFGFEREMQR
jgi:hypothetical protein